MIDGQTGSQLFNQASLTMSAFVLVHGAWQSTGTWDLLTPLLQEHGHTVVAPVLSGLGTDQNRLSPEISLRQHVEDVSRELPTMPASDPCRPQLRRHDHQRCGGS